MIFTRYLTEADLDKYVALTQSEFVEGDWCEPEYLLKIWSDLKAFVLLEDDEWAGFCAVTLGKDYAYNPGGAHFLSGVTFPKYRGRGYVKCLYKLLFDASQGYRKSACIHADNDASIRAAEKYGFKHAGQERQWELYLCDADFYPQALQGVEVPIIGA